MSSPTRGTGSPPPGCTCLITYSQASGEPLRWGVYIADADCPHHGDRIRVEEGDDA